MAPMLIEQGRSIPDRSPAVLDETHMFDRSSSGYSEATQDSVASFSYTFLPKTRSPPRRDLKVRGHDGLSRKAKPKSWGTLRIQALGLALAHRDRDGLPRGARPAGWQIIQVKSLVSLQSLR